MSTIYPANWRLPAGLKVIAANISGDSDAPVDTGAGFYSATAARYSDWPAYFSRYVRPCIDRAAEIGLNAVSMWMIAPYAVTTGIVPDNATLIGYYLQAVRYAASRGLYFIIRGHVGDVANVGSIGMTTSAFLAWIDAFAAALEAEPGVILLDVVNEGMTQAAFNAGGTAAVGYQALQRARAAAPSLPITCSAAASNNSSAMWADGANRLWAALMDVATVSVYYDWAPADPASFIAYAQGNGLPVLVGEVGGVGGGDDRKGRWLTAAAVNALDGVAGSAAWSILDPNALWTSFGLDAADHPWQWVPIAPRYGTVAQDNFTSNGGNSTADLYARSLPLPFGRGWYANPGYTPASAGPAIANLAGSSNGGGVYATEATGAQSIMLAPAEPASSSYSVFGTLQVPAGSSAANSQNGIVGLFDPVLASGFALLFIGYSTNEWHLHEVTGDGTGTDLAVAAGTLTAGTTYALELRVDPVNVAGYVDGVLKVGPVAHGLTRPGRAGLWIGGNNGANTLGQAYVGAFRLACANPIVAATAVRTASGATSATLTLAGGSGYTGIRWHRYALPGSPLSARGAVPGATSATLADSGLATGATYYYRARLTDAAGNYAETNEVAVVPSATSAASPVVAATWTHAD